MERSKKTDEIKAIAERFSKAKAAFLMDFKGMTVEQVTRVRKKLRGSNAEMRVVRNTLALRALKDFPKEEAALKDSFVGTNAIVFAYGDASAPAKDLTDAAKDIEQIQLKVGVMEGSALSAESIKALASLPSKDVLRAQLLGMLAAPMTKFVQQLNSAPSSFVRVLGSYKEQKEKQG